MGILAKHKNFDMATTKKEVVETENTPIKFGFSQITNKTPMAAKWVFRAVLYMAAVVNIILQIVVEIPEPIKALVGKYSLYAVTLVHSISKLFGVEVEEPKK